MTPQYRTLHPDKPQRPLCWRRAAHTISLVDGLLPRRHPSGPPVLCLKTYRSSRVGLALVLVSVSSLVRLSFDSFPPSLLCRRHADTNLSNRGSRLARQCRAVLCIPPILVERSWIVIVVHRGDSQHLDLQIGRRRRSRRMRIFAPAGHTHSLRCSCLPFVSTCRSNHSPPPIPCSITLLVFSVTASLRLYKLASFFAPQYCILGKRHYHDDADRPSGIVVPRTRTSSSLHASFFHRLTYTPAFSDSSHGPCHRRGQLMPLFTLARANKDS